MRKFAFAALLAFGSGCPLEASLGSQDTGGTESSESGPGPGSESTTAVGFDEWGEPETGSEGDWGTTGPDWGTETGEPAGCEVIPEDGECAECEKNHCCEPVHECLMTPHCSCIVACVFSGGTPQMCIDHCGSDGGQHTHVLACMEEHCAGPCLTE